MTWSRSSSCRQKLRAWAAVRPIEPGFSRCPSRAASASRTASSTAESAHPCRSGPRPGRRHIARPHRPTRCHNPHRIAHALPAEQTKPAGHARPQAPQLVASVIRFSAAGRRVAAGLTRRARRPPCYRRCKAERCCDAGKLHLRYIRRHRTRSGVSRGYTSRFRLRRRPGIARRSCSRSASWRRSNRWTSPGPRTLLLQPPQF